MGVVYELCKEKQDKYVFKASLDKMNNFAKSFHVQFS